MYYKSEANIILIQRIVPLENFISMSYLLTIVWILLKQFPMVLVTN